MIPFLNNRSGPFNAAIIGASGGIGKALTKALSEHEKAGTIYALSRTPCPDLEEYKNITTYPLDICDEKQIRDAAEQIQEPLHLVIIATGILHDNDVMPEKNITALDSEIMERVLLINTIGPAMVAKYFIPLFDRKERSIFAALSARVGSISDNHLGGWHSYRASKAALNMMLKNIAIESARKYKNMAVIGLHPGTVATNLSAPFQTNVKEGKLFSPQQSANYLLNVINQTSSADTGKIFAWDGEEIQP